MRAEFPTAEKLRYILKSKLATEICVPQIRRIKRKNIKQYFRLNMQSNCQRKVLLHDVNLCTVPWGFSRKNEQ